MGYGWNADFFCQVNFNGNADFFLSSLRELLLLTDALRLGAD